jgi:hypothetical protein
MKQCKICSETHNRRGNFCSKRCSTKEWLSKNTGYMVDYMNEYNQLESTIIRRNNWVKENAEHIRIQRKLDYEKNPRKEYHKNYDNGRKEVTRQRNILNRDAIYTYQKNYRKTPKGRLLLNISTREHHHRLKQIQHDFTLKEWQDKINMLSGICPMCFLKFDESIYKRRLTLDHEPSLKLAPLNFVYRIGDVTPLCHSCNSSKKNKPIKCSAYPP